MDNLENFSETHLRAIVEQCLRLALPPNAPLPSEDEDWIATGALDSMAHIDVLLCVEKVTGFSGLFDRLEGRPPTTTRSLIVALEGVASKHQATPQTAPGSQRPASGLARITGWGSALGGQQVDAAIVDREFGLAAGTIRERAGIDSVARASAQEDEVSLALKASNSALKQAASDVGDLDWIVATSETFLAFPSLGSSLHSRLLAPDACGVLDVGGACVGLLNALCVARSFSLAGLARQILVVTADVHSRALTPGRVPGEFGGLFGDGASAFVVSGVGDTEGLGPYRLGDFQFGCAGAFSSALSISPAADGAIALRFEGEALARAAVERLRTIIAELELRSGWSRHAASSFATHQPNPRLLDILAKQTGLPLAKFPVVAKTCGNLGSSTCGVALSMALAEHSPKPAGQRGPIFLAAVGPGMLWGGGVLY